MSCVGYLQSIHYKMHIGDLAFLNLLTRSYQSSYRDLSENNLSELPNGFLANAPDLIFLYV